MGVFTRDDSPYYYLYLETTGKKEPTEIRHDQSTPLLRKKAAEQARARYHERMLEVTARGGTPLVALVRTLRDQAQWYEDHVLPRRKNPEYERYILPRLVAEFGSLLLTDVTKARVTEWKNRLLTTATQVAAKKHVKARTVHTGESAVERMTDVLKAVMQSAVPEHLAASPIYGLRRLKGKTPKRGLLKPEDEARLLKIMKPEDAALLVLGMDGLVRLNDLLDLRREHDEQTQLWIADSKTDRGFYIPVSKRARKYLDKIPKGDSPYYFPHRRISDTATEKQRRHGVKQMLQRYCARAGVTYGRAKGGITFHWATRRTGLTRMLSNGVPVATAMKVGRWKNEHVPLTVYHDLIGKDAHDAVNAVSRSRSVPGRGKRRKNGRRS